MHAGLGHGHGFKHSLQLLEVGKARLCRDGRYSSLSLNSAKAFTEIDGTGSVTSENVQPWPNRMQLPRPLTSPLHSFPFQRFMEFLHF